MQGNIVYKDQTDWQLTWGCMWGKGDKWSILIGGSLPSGQGQIVNIYKGDRWMGKI